MVERKKRYTHTDGRSSHKSHRCFVLRTFLIVVLLLSFHVLVDISLLLLLLLHYFASTIIVVTAVRAVLVFRKLEKVVTHQRRA